MASDNTDQELVVGAADPDPVLLDTPQLRSQHLLRQAEAELTHHQVVRDAHRCEIRRAVSARDLSATARAAPGMSTLRRQARVYLRWCAHGHISVEAARDCLSDDIREEGVDIDASTLLYLEALEGFPRMELGDLDL